MKESIEVFGSLSVKDLIIYGMAFYWVYRIGKGWYFNAIKYHEKEKEHESAIILAKENRDKIDNLAQKIEKFMRSFFVYNENSIRDKLFICYNSAKNQGCITIRQLENFNRNYKFYEEIGGDDDIVKKYKCEIDEMRVVEEVPVKEKMEAGKND